MPMPCKKLKEQNSWFGIQKLYQLNLKGRNNHRNEKANDSNFQNYIEIIHLE